MIRDYERYALYAIRGYPGSRHVYIYHVQPMQYRLEILEDLLKRGYLLQDADGGYFISGKGEEELEHDDIAMNFNWTTSYTIEPRNYIEYSSYGYNFKDIVYL